MSTTAYVNRLPLCDVCNYWHGVQREATYDARTTTGRWANLCEEHFDTETDGQLGTGHGQQLVVGTKPQPTAREIQQAIADGDFDLAEDLIGDGDIVDFI